MASQTNNHDISYPRTDTRKFIPNEFCARDDNKKKKDLKLILVNLYCENVFVHFSRENYWTDCDESFAEMKLMN